MRLTLPLVRARLATRDDSRVGPPARDRRPAAGPREDTLTPAAVLVPLLSRGNDLTVLFTRRTDTLRRHAGQISFPGGRIDHTDLDAVTAALREAEEEIGLPATLVDVIGELDPYETGTGYRIVPVVGAITAAFDLTPAPHEVAEVFEAPLGYLMNPANYVLDSIDIGGVARSYYRIDHGHHRIWGATAGMLHNLALRLRD